MEVKKTASWRTRKASAVIQNGSTGLENLEANDRSQSDSESLVTRSANVQSRKMAQHKQSNVQSKSPLPLLFCSIQTRGAPCTIEGDLLYSVY